MMNVKMICFDMDGTVADLYAVPGWLNALRSYDPAPYEQAEPMWNMERLSELLRKIQTTGIEIRIITWLSKESTPEYDKMVRESKRRWLEKYNFPYDHFHGVKYGTTKANCIRHVMADGAAILFDDNATVRKGWHLGEAIDPMKVDILEVLENILGD